MSEYRQSSNLCSREVAAFAMVSGILCVALPTTILAVEFADKYQVQRQSGKCFHFVILFLMR